MDMLEIRGHVEGNTVDYSPRSVVYKLEFDVFEVAPYQFAGAEILDSPGAECRLAVAGAEGVEQTQNRYKLGGYVGKREKCVDIDLGASSARAVYWLTHTPRSDA